jgi:hypothetical protein
MSGKLREELDLQTIPTNEEGPIIDHYRIQHKIISYFKDWNCIPKTLDPADHLTTLNLLALLAISPQKVEKHQNLNKRSRIPEDMQKGLQNTVGRRSLLKWKLIKFGDFMAALKDTING